MLGFSVEEGGRVARKQFTAEQIIIKLFEVVS